MGMNASAYLFYGVTVSEKQALKIIKKYSSDIPDESYGEIYEALEAVLDDLGYESVSLQTEVNNPDEFVVACWYDHYMDLDDYEVVGLPKQSQLDKDWAKLSKELGIKKKPKLMIHTTFG